MSTFVNGLLHLHGALALAIVFLLPFGESAVFVGFVFPGETAAILAGVLAYQHRIPLPLGLLAVALGAVLGDSVGYWVGHRWGIRVLEGPLARWIKADHVAQTRRVVQRRGGFAVFVGRWTTALRVLVPGLAGVARIPYHTFLFWNVLGGVCWALTFVLLGYGAGASWHRVASGASTAGLGVLAAALVTLTAIILLRRRRRRRHGLEERSKAGTGPEVSGPGAGPEPEAATGAGTGTHAQQPEAETGAGIHAQQPEAETGAGIHAQQPEAGNGAESGAKTGTGHAGSRDGGAAGLAKQRDR